MTEQQTSILVPEKLREIEQTEGVRVLYAAESGSRAWDFASPDSDFDVRFLYVRPREYYLRLDKTRDVLEYPIDDTWDVSGWDLNKALRLLHGGNLTLFEWAGSPIVYHTTSLWEEKIRPLLPDYFQPKTGLWHYCSMAKNNCRSYLERETIKAKRYFYILRPLLACRWILERRSPVPMRFSELVESQLPPELRPVVEELVRRKRETPELGEIPNIPALDAYIRAEFEELHRRIEAEPEQPAKPWEPLNRMFLQTLEAFAA